MSVCFVFRPNTVSGEFHFYFHDGEGDEVVLPWDAIRDWYLADGARDDVKGCIDRSRDEDNFAYRAMVLNPDPACPLLAFRSTPHNPTEIGYLVHEIHHAVQRHADAVGIYAGSTASEEFFCYMEQHLLVAALEAVWHGVAVAGVEGLCVDGVAVG